MQTATIVFTHVVLFAQIAEYVVKVKAIAQQLPLSPRDIVKKTVDMIVADNKRFWGRYAAHTRRRTAEDAFITLYFDDM